MTKEVGSSVKIQYLVYFTILFKSVISFNQFVEKEMQ